LLIYQLNAKIVVVNVLT